MENFKANQKDFNRQNQQMTLGKISCRCKEKKHSLSHCGAYSQWRSGRHLWIGRDSNPGLCPQTGEVEVFNVWGSLTHGDSLAFVEHRLIPAGVRSECSGLTALGLAFFWALASQESSYVGNAGVGVRQCEWCSTVPAVL